MALLVVKNFEVILPGANLATEFVVLPVKRFVLRVRR